MHDAATIERVLTLVATGRSISSVARWEGLPRATVACWAKGQTPRTFQPGIPHCSSCGWPEHDFESPPAEYAYLFGLYLGDGCISAQPRGVYSLRVTLDLRYPAIIEECAASMGAVLPGNRVNRVNGLNPSTGKHTYVTVGIYSRMLPCLFPQHGPGMKHTRAIQLADWQKQVIAADPKPFLRGLIHSDGCRFINTGTNWVHPRYTFSNRSEDILGIFRFVCGLLGVHTTTCPHTVYVSRKDDVAFLDTFIGPKS